MAVITVSRQLGSLGREVGRLVADQLGYRFTWREMINEAARRASTPEVALATIDELDLLGLVPSTQACKAYCDAIQQVMTELAREGNVVIVGRAGQIVLRDYPGVLSIRIIAPYELRAQRTAARQGITLEAARSQVEASDNHRRAYLQRVYQAQWDDPMLYDLVLNTAKFTVQEAANIICPLALQYSAARTSNSSHTGGAR